MFAPLGFEHLIQGYQPYSLHCATTSFFVLTFQFLVWKSQYSIKMGSTETVSDIASTFFVNMNIVYEKALKYLILNSAKKFCKLFLCKNPNCQKEVKRLAFQLFDRL